MGFTFEPNRFYGEHELLAPALFTFSELKRARDRGELRFKEVSRGRRTYLGAWLLAWLTGEGQQQTTAGV